ncbi:glycogen synthase, putative, partial [Eimeria necatrix]
VHLILEAAETLITKHRGRVQLLLGGLANWKDGYAARCATKMMELRWKYPQSFWADPNEFFTKGKNLLNPRQRMRQLAIPAAQRHFLKPRAASFGGGTQHRNMHQVEGAHVNYGADFGLMPSAFEPGGIVQHEFFISGTPVIAFHTGGLKDTVVEFVPSTGTGNGFCFLNYTSGDLLYAMERAIRVFDDKEKYALLRQLARRSVVSCESSSWAWLCEFARLRNKMPINENKVQQIYERLPEWSEGAWRKRKDQLAAAAVGLPSPPGSSWGAPQGQQQQQQQQLLLLQQQAEAAAEFWALPSSTANKGRRKTKLRIDSSSSSSSSSSTSSTSEGETPQSHLSSSSSSSSRRSSTDTAASHKPASHTNRPKKLLPSTIRYMPPQGKPRPRSVAVAGSFDDWRVRRPLTWDNAIQAFAISLALPPGEYTYKLVVDGEWVCCHDSPTARDPGGNENNILVVE